jgi:VanZ family protein
LDDSSVKTSDSHFGRRKWLTHFAPLVVWTIVILGLGGQIGSMNETSRFIRPLLEFLFPTSAPETLTFIHGIIRKLAHFTEYFVLGFLAFRLFSIIAKQIGVLIAAAILIALAVASIDEWQQSFIPTRTSSPYDVLIDLSGAVVAILIFALLWRNRAK